MNAGTGDLSVFRVNGANLDFVHVVSSGGSAPVAIAQRGNLVYVINFAGNSNVVGFNLNEDGHLVMIPNSIRYLSATNTGPSSLAFSPDGRFLLLTEKVTNNIDVFSVNGDGTLSQPTITPDPIPGVFDVVFSPDEFGGFAIQCETCQPKPTTPVQAPTHCCENWLCPPGKEP